LLLGLLFGTSGFGLLARQLVSPAQMVPSARDSGDSGVSACVED
jgi:hypothetical protein